ncbi:MAG: methylaspartate ammonia-lyase, partial [Bacilli bacterium]
MRIKDVVLSKSHTGFYFDDQLAIKAGARTDGFVYVGAPMLPGYRE